MNSTNQPRLDVASTTKVLEDLLTRLLAGLKTGSVKELSTVFEAARDLWLQINDCQQPDLQRRLQKLRRRSPVRSVMEDLKTLNEALVAGTQVDPALLSRMQHTIVAHLPPAPPHTVTSTIAPARAAASAPAPVPAPAPTPAPTSTSRAAGPSAPAVTRPLQRRCVTPPPVNAVAAAMRDSLAPSEMQWPAEVTAARTYRASRGPESRLPPGPSELIPAPPPGTGMPPAPNPALVASRASVTSAAAPPNYPPLPPLRKMQTGVHHPRPKPLPTNRVQPPPAPHPAPARTIRAAEPLLPWPAQRSFQDLDQVDDGDMVLFNEIPDNAFLGHVEMASPEQEEEEEEEEEEEVVEPDDEPKVDKHGRCWQCNKRGERCQPRDSGACEACNKGKRGCSLVDRNKGKKAKKAAKSGPPRRSKQESKTARGKKEKKSEVFVISDDEPAQAPAKRPPPCAAKAMSTGPAAIPPTPATLAATPDVIAAAEALASATAAATEASHTLTLDLAGISQHATSVFNAAGQVAKDVRAAHRQVEGLLVQVRGIRDEVKNLALEVKSAQTFIESARVTIEQAVRDIRHSDLGNRVLRVEERAEATGGPLASIRTGLPTAPTPLVEGWPESPNPPMTPPRPTPAEQPWPSRPIPLPKDDADVIWSPARGETEARPSLVPEDYDSDTGGSPSYTPTPSPRPPQVSAPRQGGVTASSVDPKAGVSTPEPAASLVPEPPVVCPAGSPVPQSPLLPPFSPALTVQTPPPIPAPDAPISSGTLQDMDTSDDDTVAPSAVDAVQDREVAEGTAAMTSADGPAADTQPPTFDVNVIPPTPHTSQGDEQPTANALAPPDAAKGRRGRSRSATPMEVDAEAVSRSTRSRSRGVVPPGPAPSRSRSRSATPLQTGPSAAQGTKRKAGDADGEADAGAAGHKKQKK
ncbi:hypothetical protein FPV67DRAFT_1676295 [Lyophyllum atratum]|nr:hypothetical protein FPV67DRAFT_1676295 [Lyophyllum atratum]